MSNETGESNEVLRQDQPGHVLPTERNYEIVLDAGPIPSGSYLPLTCSPVFTGRNEELLWLVNQLLPPHPVVVLLTGPAGVGKSSLAVEFCFRYGRFYDGVHWIYAGDFSTLDSELANCGEKMELSDWPAGTSAQAEVVRWAWKRSHHLVVLDGVNDPTQMIEWARSLEGCSILVTSRIAIPAGTFPGMNILPVSRLMRDDGSALVRKLSPRLVQTPLPELQNLSAKLGDLPFFLTLAGQNLGERSWESINHYMNDVEFSSRNLPEAVISLVSAMPGINMAMAAVLYTSLQPFIEPEELDRDINRQFQVLAACAPDFPVPILLIRLSLQVDDTEVESLEGNLLRLYDLGLLEESDQGPVVISTVSTFLASLFPPTDELFDSLLASLEELTSQAGSNTAFYPYRAHLKAAAAFAEKYSYPYAVPFLRLLGHKLLGLGEYPDAVSVLQQALTLIKPGQDSDDFKVAHDYFSLGSAYLAMDDLLNARESFETSLSFTLKTEHKDQPWISRIYAHLGRVLHILGDLPGARECFERAQILLDEAFPEPGSEKAASIRNLGHVLLDLNEYSSALVCFNRSLALNTTVYGQAHPETSEDLFFIGRTQFALGNLKEARANYETALSIRELKWGKNSSETLSAAAALGRVFLDLGEAQSASGLYSRILTIYEQVTGPNSPEVASVLISFGRAKRMLGDAHGAKRSFERALQIDTMIFGEKNQVVARDLNHLGRVERSLGNLSAAKACFERVIEIDKTQWSQAHPELATDYNNLGLVLEEMGDFEASRQCFNKALQVDEQFFGPNHPNVSRDANNLGSVLQTLGDLDGALAAYRRALEISIQNYGESHPDIATNYNNQGRVLFALGDLQGARSSFEHALAIDKQVANGENQEVASDAHNLGRVLLELQDYAGAQAAFSLAISIRKKKFPIDHPKVRALTRSLEIVNDVIREMGAPDR